MKTLTHHIAPPSLRFVSFFSFSFRSLCVCVWCIYSWLIPFLWHFHSHPFRLVAIPRYPACDAKTCARVAATTHRLTGNWWWQKKLYIQSTNNSKEFSYENAQAIENCVCARKKRIWLSEANRNQVLSTRCIHWNCVRGERKKEEWRRRDEDEEKHSTALYNESLCIKSRWIFRNTSKCSHDFLLARAPTHLKSTFGMNKGKLHRPKNMGKKSETLPGLLERIKWLGGLLFHVPRFEVVRPPKWQDLRIKHEFMRHFHPSAIRALHISFTQFHLASSCDALNHAACYWN